VAICALGTGAVLVAHGRGSSSAPPEPGTRSSFAAAACTGPDWCLAVGSYSDGSAERRALAEAWDGSGWQLLNPLSPSGDTALAAIACPASQWCLAVGTTGPEEDPARRHALAERWTGAGWSLVTLPAVAEPSALAAVECRTASSCQALGWSSSTGSAQPFVDAWDGRRWRHTWLPIPDPGANEGAQLGAIACPSSGFCKATGLLSTNDGGDGTRTLAETWNGSTWEIGSTPSPAVLAGDLSSLQGVACSATASCIAVGFYDAGNVFNAARRALIESWNGAGWTQSAAPGLPAGLQSALAAVACTGSDRCLAVGATTDPSGNPAALVEEWDGRAWSVLPKLAFPGSLHAVTCPAAGICLLAGERCGRAYAIAGTLGSSSMAASIRDCDSSTSSSLPAKYAS
jgi:hypothetical protein